MRQLTLYAVIDERARTIIGPVVHDHSSVPIVRQITEAVNKQGSLIANNPEDFAIYELGYIDEENGQILPHEDGPVKITTALALKAASE